MRGRGKHWRHRLGGTHTTAMNYFEACTAMAMASELSRDRDKFDKWEAKPCEVDACGFWHVVNENGEYLRR